MAERRGWGQRWEISSYNRLHCSFSCLRRRHIGLCNFNYFISGNPSNIQRRRYVEGELPTVPKLQGIRRRRFYFSFTDVFSSSFVVTFFRQLFLLLSPDLSTSRRLYPSRSQLLCHVSSTIDSSRCLTKKINYELQQCINSRFTSDYNKRKQRRHSFSSTSIIFGF